MRGAGGLKQALLLLFVWVSSVFGVLPVQAQPQYDKVVVPWGNVPPLSMMGEDGEPTGFAIELARLLAEEVGFELEFQFYGPIPKIAAAQATGETDMLVGVGHGPAFRETNLASQTISEVQVRLAVPVENADDFDPNNLSGVRIAAVPPTIASNPDLFPDATVVEQPGLEAALVTLLSGEVDALSYPVNVLFALTRATRTDGRIAYVGDPLVRIDRVVIVHQSRAELLEPINKALQKFEENGTLEELRIKYLISNPEPVPDVLTVGVHHVPPFVSIGDDGTPGGFGIEVLEDLVDLAGLQIRYQRITDEEFGQGPREGSVDLIPMMAINPTRAERMDFTFPVHRIPFNIFTLREASLEPQVLDDLVGLRVGVESGKNAAQLAERHGGLDIVYADGKDGIMNLLLEGQADAVLTTGRAFWTHLQAEGQEEKFRSSTEPFYVSESGPALRLGLGEVRERLNAVIPAYLISEEYEALQAKWFGRAPFWTPMRLRLVGAAVLVLVLTALGFGIWQKLQRSRAQERQARLLQHSRQLEVLVDELERSNRELDSFADIASHDLKQPLRGIHWQLRALQERAADALPEEVSRIEQLCAQMEATISDLLASAQHRGKGSDRADIDTGVLVDEICTDLSELMEATGGEVQVETAMPMVFASRAKAKVVFQNLIANGLIYNQSSTPVVKVGYLSEGSTDASGLLHVFYIRDNGTGIAPEDQGRIFLPGVRGQNTGERVLPGATGSGLGLSFAKEIVESYGQLITFESVAGQGTTFFFSLPNAKGESAGDVVDHAGLVEAE